MLAAPIRRPLPPILSPSDSYLTRPPRCSESRSTSRGNRRAPATILVRTSLPHLSLAPFFFSWSCASDRHAVLSPRIPGRRGAPHLDITVRGCNSDEGLPGNQSVSTLPTLPPSLPRRSTSSGKSSTS
jgi:hypothetical protein